MWKSRYKNLFKTSNPNLIITGVKSFPNIIDTVEKAIVDYKVKEFQKDPLLLEIESLFWLENGRDFIPLYFEDDCPKLKNLKPFKEKGMFWCVGYINPAVTSRNAWGRSITLPTHDRFKDLLEYAVKTNNNCWKYLFEQCITQYVYEKTKNWADVQKQRRFKFICNTGLHVMNASVNKYPTPDMCMPFIENMYKRDIYEFIFNEYI